MAIGTPKYFQDRGVAHKLQKRSLLIAVNLVAGLSIFFFGYDQGVMAGVNTNRSYAKLMNIGYWSEQKQKVQIDQPLSQGGIVSACLPKPLYSLALISPSRSQSTTSRVHCTLAPAHVEKLVKN